MILTSETMRRLMCERTDRIARVGSRDSARRDGLSSYPAWKGVRALFCMRLVLCEVGIVHVVAGEWQLLLGRGRVA